MFETLFNSFITWYIVFLGVFNLVRITTFIIGADIYRFKRLKRNAFFEQNPLTAFPFITVILPAYNEELTVEACLTSFSNVNYPADKLKVFLVNDGSNDSTLSLAKSFLKKNPSEHISIIDQKNAGKAHALNTAIRKAPKHTDIVVCMDSDCSIDKDGLMKIAQYFRYYPNLLALASHVNIIPEKTLLNLAQRFEYTISYQIKRALTTFNIEYIIGGIGSAFSYKDLIKYYMYDTNTMTEDIDLTLKLMKNEGNKGRMIGYADDVMTYAEAVPDLKGLMRQRFRWKYGRMQAFYKHKELFFNRSSKFNPLLTCVYLPLEVLFEVIFLFEPLIIGWFLYLAITYRDTATLFSAMIFSIIYASLSLVGEDMISRKSRIALILLTPVNFLINYAVAWSEYYSLITSIIKLPKLPSSFSSTSSKWVSPKRTGAKLIS
jgi:poly-beta-1,6-N-acetyl-D-glucosamine synthase